MAEALLTTAQPGLAANLAGLLLYFELHCLCGCCKPGVCSGGCPAQLKCLCVTTLLKRCLAFSLAWPTGSS
jgi:hypothetical protein